MKETKWCNHIKWKKKLDWWCWLKNNTFMEAVELSINFCPFCGRMRPDRDLLRDIK